jgi:hypothetical protein
MFINKGKDNLANPFSIKEKRIEVNGDCTALHALTRQAEQALKTQKENQPAVKPKEDKK